MNNIKEMYLLLLHKMKNNREWAITGLFALFVLLSFGISYNLASVRTASSNDKKLPIYCVDTPDKKIAISFDAAWGNEDTPKLLEILKKNNVKATFFMTGGWVDK